MILPNDVCRCVNETCPLKDYCLRHQAFLDDRERSKIDESLCLEPINLSYARFNFWTNHGEHEHKHDCDHIIRER